MAYIKIADRRIKKTRLNALSVAKMLSALLDGATSITELTDVSGLHIHTVREYVNTLLKEKCIHVSGWDKDSRGKPCIRVFTLGHGKSVSMPTKTKAQSDKEYRERRKQRKLNRTIANITSKTDKDASFNFKYVKAYEDEVPLITEQPLTQEEIWGTKPKKYARG